MWRPTEALLALLILAVTPAGSQEEPPSADISYAGHSFFAIRVVDVGAASGWYQETLGLREVKRLDAEDGRYNIRLLSTDGLNVELIQLRDLVPPEPRQSGLFKAGFFVEDILALHRHLGKFGVEKDEQPFVDEALSARSFVFRDLDGNRLQAFEHCEGGCR